MLARHHAGFHGLPAGIETGRRASGGGRGRGAGANQFDNRSFSLRCDIAKTGLIRGRDEYVRLSAAPAMWVGDAGYQGGIARGSGPPFLPVEPRRRIAGLISQTPLIGSPVAARAVVPALLVAWPGRPPPASL